MGAEEGAAALPAVPEVPHFLPFTRWCPPRLVLPSDGSLSQHAWLRSLLACMHFFPSLQASLEPHL